MMITQLEAVTSYIYKYCDAFTTRQVKGNSSLPGQNFLPASPCARAAASSFSDPPPYGDVLPPPAYNSVSGRLCLIDRSDQTFKIYHTDLLALSKEWSRRSGLKGDCLEVVTGGPGLAPRRIMHMRELFMSIVEHQPCPRQPGAPSCDCRITRWAHLKQEWIEVMFLLGHDC